MLGIGEFAGLTGLSVKALRHYDEKGVLVPADVDDRTAYRRYDGRQVRTGVVIRALREAGVPLPAVAGALGSGDLVAALEQHRDHVRRQREAEDRALEAAAIILRALEVPVTVAERTCREQPYLARVISIAPEEADTLTDDDANEVFGSVYAEVQALGLGPTGQFWTALRAGEDGQLVVMCCWPTSAGGAR